MNSFRNHTRKIWMWAGPKREWGMKEEGGESRGENRGRWNRVAVSFNLLFRENTNVSVYVSCLNCQWSQHPYMRTWPKYKRKDLYFFSVSLPLGLSHSLHSQDFYHWSLVSKDWHNRLFDHKNYLSARVHGNCSIFQQRQRTKKLKAPKLFWDW